MVIFLYNLYIFWIHLPPVLYPKSCKNKPCYNEVVVYKAFKKFLWMQSFKEAYILITCFSFILYKGDNFSGFLLAFLHTKSLLKRDLLEKLGSKFFPFRVDPFSEERQNHFDKSCLRKGRQNHFDRVVSPESISFPLIVI